MTMINWDFVYDYENQIPPWGPLGYITYKRTYARMTETGVTEEWWQTIYRCLRSLVDDLDAILTQEEVEKLYDYVFKLKCVFSGRALWQLGTGTISKIGADSLQNCWHVAVDTPITPFTFTFNQLMLGGGVGFNIQAEHVYALPKVRYDPRIRRVDNHDVGFIIPDNREGWVELLERILHAYFYSGHSFSYSTIAIRNKGARISSFGGTASGPEELSNGMLMICKILSSRFGQKLRPIDCLDIMNIIGTIVVAGNVRRSAQIAIGDANDNAFINSKAWGRGNIPNWRSMSNNSVACDDPRQLGDNFWKNYTETNSQGDAVSEPFGLVNLHNCRRFGRLADGEGYRPDPHIVGLNPCGEVTLESYEACNLAEIFLPNIKDAEEFADVACLMYKVTKTISRYPFQSRIVNEVVSRNHRLGISVSGLLQAQHLRTEAAFNNCYRRLESLDAEYSKYLGCSKSVKMTCVKPSGTVSLLAGVTPGIHPAYAPYYIRRIRFASNDPVVAVCAEHGYIIEPQLKLDGTQDYNTQIVQFPVATPKGTLCANEIGAITQLEYMRWAQENWADNSVSVTVYYKDEELPEICEWLAKHYTEDVKAVSFLRHSKHGFVQAPYEPIAEGHYNNLISKITPVTTLRDVQQLNLKDSVECISGACPIK